MGKKADGTPTRMLSVRVPAEILKALSRRVVEEETSAQKIVNDLLKDALGPYLKKRGA